LTTAQLDELWPLPPGSDMGPPEAQRPKDDHADLAVPAMPALPWMQPPAGASNSFAVDGRLSASGKPLLANDPHLRLQTPSQWYLGRIETPTLRLAGATAPGVPLLIIGHNGHVAWSFTTTQADTQDLFREQTIAGDDAHYVTPQGPAAFETREET